MCLRFRVVGLVLSVLATLSCACVPRAPLTCHDHGGPVWSELSSPRLVLRTDVDAGDARAMLAELTGLRDALAHVMPRPRRAPAEALEVVVFDRRRDYRALGRAERSPAGFFTRQLDADFEPRPVVVVYDDPRVGRGAVFLHELAHRFLRERFASLPPWLDEGLAQLYETIRVEPGRVVLGERRSEAYADFADFPLWSRAPTVQDLVIAGEREFYAREGRAERYAASWRLVHLLASRFERRFAALLGDLERGVGSRQAFARAFGDEMGRLEAAYEDYLTRRALPTRSVAYQRAPEPPARHHLMPDAMVHLLWARLRSWDGRSRGAVEQDLDEALALDPGAPEERYVRARLYDRLGREDDAARELDAALAARPDDPRYLYARLVVGCERGAWDEGRRDVLARLSRVATSAAQLGLVADELGVVRERAREGLSFVQRALLADPMCWWCERTKARILFGERRYAEAVAAADQALALVPEGDVAKGLRSERAFLAQLAALEARAWMGSGGVAPALAAPTLR